MEVVLTIAGSDSSGGSGIQGDLKTFEAFGIYGTSVVTAISAQNTVGVVQIVPLEGSVVRAQIDAVMSDFEVKAIKVGMLYTKDIIVEIKEFLKELDKKIPVVLDPIAISKTASKLLNNEAMSDLKELFEFVTLMTPNSAEFKEFFGDLESAKEFSNNNNVNILIKDLTNQETKESIDVLIRGDEVKNFKTEKLTTKNTYGTGCAFSSAITSLLAKEMNLEGAIFTAKKFIYHAIKNGPTIGKGTHPINHKIGFSEIEDYV